MNHYDVTIRETLEVKMKVAANSREAVSYTHLSGDVVNACLLPPAPV